MITKDLLKAEIDKVPDEHLGVLYKIVKALEEEPARKELDEAAWKAFIAEAYGSMGDAPIERGEQGHYEVREPLE